MRTVQRGLQIKQRRPCQFPLESFILICVIFVQAFRIAGKLPSSTFVQICGVRRFATKYRQLQPSLPLEFRWPVKPEASQDRLPWALDQPTGRKRSRQHKSMPASVHNTLMSRMTLPGAFLQRRLCPRDTAGSQDRSSALTQTKRPSSR